MVRSEPHHPRLAIPRTLNDINPSWLTATLHKSKVIPDQCKVVKIAPEKTGPGVAGTVFRLRILYENGEGPSSLIVKLSAGDSFALQRFPNKLETEVGFYRDIGNECGANVPKCYYAANDLKTGSFCIIMEDSGKGIDTISSSIRLTEPEWHCLLNETAKMHAKWWQSPKAASLPWMRTFKKRRRGPIGTIIGFYARISKKMVIRINTGYA